MKLKSVELVNALSAAFEQLQVLTQTSVNINQNVVTAEQGNFLLFARFIDTFYIEDGSRPSDQMVFEFFKTLTDDYAAADAATLTFNKSLEDKGYVLDRDKIKFIKGAFEEIATTDEYYFEFAKALSEIVTNAEDHAYIFTKKAREEAVGFNDDVIAKLTALGKQDAAGTADAHTYDFRKPLVDAFAVAEANYLAIGKVLFDQVASTEDYVVLFTKKAADEVVASIDVIQKAFGRGFSDASSLSDSHAIATGKPIAEIVASVGDQAFVFTKKAADEFVGTTDDDTIAFAKALADHGYIAEAIDTIGFGKAIGDATALTDTINTFGIEKVLTDSVYFTDDVDGTASILDDQEMQFRKIKTDVAGVAESFYRQVNFSRAYSDAAGTTDDELFAVGKYLVDVPAAYDSINMLTGKQIYDIPVASENLAKSFSRPRSDSALLGDATIVAAGKVLLDLASTTDAGSLRSQGYSDFTYFSEDYVGASTTF